MSMAIRNFLYLLLVITASFSFAKEIDWHQIKDSSLQRCAKEIMLSHGWQSWSEVTYLKCHDMNIKSLEGIELFDKIENLSLYKNDIEEIPNGLSVSLVSLNVAENKLTQLSLSGLHSLEKVFLFRNQLQYLALIDLPKLKEAKINNNQLTRIELDKLDGLEKLYLFDNQLETMSLTPFVGLKYMDVRHNPMPDELYDEMDGLSGVTVLHDGNADDW